MKSGVISDWQSQAVSSDVSVRAKSTLANLIDTLKNDKGAQALIAAILFSNIFWIALHCSVQVSRQVGVSDENFLIQNFDLFRIDRDGSYAEWFLYLQTALCVVLLFGVFRASRQPVYLAWALTFLFVVVDDSFLLHERASIYLVNTFDIPALPGLRPHESGELLSWAVAGTVLLGVLGWGFLRSRPQARIAGGLLALAFGALVCFAIGVDMLHVALSEPGAALYGLLAIIEDGGEMLSIALACAIALLLYRHPALAVDRPADTALFVPSRRVPGKIS